MQGQAGENSNEFAGKLRKRITDAERALWQRLRGEQLDAKFRRQHPFAGYVLDFVCLERRLVVEVDGSQHAEAAEYDRERSEVLERAGFRVLRFWNNEVLGEMEAVVERIWRELRKDEAC